MSLLEARKISKKYRRKQVLNNVNFEVNEGEIVGVLGLNGVGKTTFLKSITGNLKIDKGEILFEGEQISKASPLTDVLFVPDKIIIPRHMRVSDAVLLFKKKNPNFDESYLNEFLKLLDLDVNKAIKDMSKGTKELVQLGLLISNRPKLLILDEPLAAVDIVKRDLILNMLIDLQQDGTTILISTHLVSDIESIMSRVITIANQTIELDEEVEDIYERTGLKLSDYLIQVSEGK